MGVDRSIRIDDSRALDPYAVARILGAVVEKEAPHVVIMASKLWTMTQIRSVRCWPAC